NSFNELEQDVQIETFVCERVSETTDEVRVRIANHTISGIVVDSGGSGEVAVRIIDVEQSISIGFIHTCELFTKEHADRLSFKRTVETETACQNLIVEVGDFVLVRREVERRIPLEITSEVE